MSERQSKGVYYGGQLPKGGGEWIGSEPYDLESLVQSIPAPATPVAAAAAPVARELDGAFAELQQLARDNLSGPELASVLNDIDILQTELENSSGANNGLCIRTLRRIAVSLPDPGPALMNLLEDPLVGGRIDANLRMSFEALING